MKRMISLLLALALVFAYIPVMPVQVNAETSGYYTYTVTNGEATITSCVQPIHGSITIPSELDGYPVTGIGDWAFSYDYNMTGVVIPDSVTSIGEAAFWACSSLVSVVIPDSVTSIGYDAFCKCSRLTGIWVDENNPYYSSDRYGVLFNKDQTTLVRAPGAISDYIIPDSVTSIDNVAFIYCDNLTKVEIPVGVTHIGEGAFQHCDNLMDVEIPDSVVSIGVSAFGNCRSLTNVVIGDSVASIGYDAFADCGSLIGIWVDENNATYSSDSYGVLFNKDQTTLVRAPGALTDYIIPDSVTSIGEYAFSWCGSLANVEIPRSVISIGEYAFHGCSYLSSITIPDSVTSIGSYAFYDCSDLTSVEISDGVTSIGDFAFHGCNNLIGIKIPDSVTSIGEYAFDCCYKMASVDISDSITSIEYRAFAECRSLTSIVIPDGVTSIDSYAFHYCTNLASVEIPGSVTSIDRCAFAECSSLKDVYYDGTEEQWNEIDIGFLNEYLTNATIHFSEEVSADDTIQEYLTWEIVDGKATITECDRSISGDIVIPSALDGYPVTGIGDYVFYYCRELTGVTIPNRVTTIDEWAFGYCSNLSNITFGNGLINIGESAFQGCNGLTELTIPDNVEIIDRAAFCGCENLNSVIIGEGVTTIGEQAFSSCGNLVSATLGSNVTSIGDAAFMYCSDLVDINIPDNVVYIGEGAFKSCSSLRSIEIPDSVTSVGAEMLYFCGSLEQVVIGSGITEISDRMFYYCNHLKNITLGENITKIGNNAFQNCKLLPAITIPNGATEIGENAFNGCMWLETITIPKSVTKIADYAFYGCSSMMDVYYGGSESTWNAISMGSSNSWLTAATIHYGEEDSADDTTWEYLSWDVTDGNAIIVGCDPSASGNIVIPATLDGYPVTTIDEWVFYDCNNLESVTIPASVTTIFGSAFSGCSALTGIWVDGNSPYYSSDDYGVLFNKDQTTLVAAPSGISGSYTIPDGVTYIDNCAFSCCSNLEYLSVPDSVARIGYEVLYDCTSLVYNTYENARYLGNAENPYVVFIGTDSPEITATTIHEDTKVIFERAFSDCSDLQSVYIPDGVRSIGQDAFAWCSGLTEITIPGSVLSIDHCAFYGCTNLQSITIPNSVTSIGEGVFYNCHSLTTVYYQGTEEQKENIEIGYSNDILLNATWIYEDSADDTPLEYLTWDVVNGEAIVTGYDESIGSDIVIPDVLDGYPVTGIGDYAFYGNMNLTSIEIPNSITSIGVCAFDACPGLTDIYYSGTQAQWNAITIYSGNAHLTNATIHTQAAVEHEYIVNGEVVIAEYDTLEEALATVTGGTIKLFADTTVANVILKSGVTLDLNGYTLTANLFVAMNGATITDGGDTCTGGGLLRVPSENMAYARDDGQGVIPVWNGVDGYVFTKVTFQQLARTVGEGTAQYIFLPAFSNPDAAALLADGGYDNGLKIKVDLTWAGGQSQQFYTYDDSFVAQVFASNGGLAFSLTVTGIGGISDMTASAVIVTDSGAQASASGTPIAA